MVFLLNFESTNPLIKYLVIKWNDQNGLKAIYLQINHRFILFTQTTIYLSIILGDPWHLAVNKWIIDIDITYVGVLHGLCWYGLRSMDIIWYDVGHAILFRQNGRERGKRNYLFAFCRFCLYELSVFKHYPFLFEMYMKRMLNHKCQRCLLKHHKISVLKFAM